MYGKRNETSTSWCSSQRRCFKRNESIYHEAAKELNVSRKQLSEIVNETAAVSAEMAVRLENGFGINAEFWLDMQKNFDIWKVKSSGRVQGIHRIVSQAV